MTTTHDNSLEYVPIVGPGVTALDNRKEYNNNKQVTANGLRESIEKVKAKNFKALKMLFTAAREIARTK